jgi:integrase
MSQPVVDSFTTPSTNDPEHLRFGELNALAGILPYHRRDELSELLSDADVATLRHLVETGMGANTLRALASDLAYLERWCLAATNSALPWPAPAALVLKFIAHHLYDPIRKEADANHGIPDSVAEILRSSGTLKTNGPHAPATVKRRLALWSTMHAWRSLPAPFADGQIRTALRLAVRAAARSPQRKSDQSITSDIIEKLLATCWLNRLIDHRDKAIILLAFSSGGRRRSEVAALRVEDIVTEAELTAEPGLLPPNSPSLPCRSIRLGRTKTTTADERAISWLIGRPVLALDTWLERSNITKGPLFRAIDQWDHVSETALTPQAINLILKKRIGMAGLDPALYSAHGLRSGFLTEAARQGVPLPEAMAQSQHRSVQQAARYYNDAERKMGKAARLLG